MSPQRNLRLTLVATIVVTTAVLVANWHIDPLGLSVAPGATGPAAGDDPRSGNSFLRKAFAVNRVKPAAVILGTSRADNGLDSAHPAFAENARPVFNFALAGASIAQMRELLVHAQHTRPLAMAVLGLDLEAFLPGGRTDFDRSVLAGNPDSTPEWMSKARLNLSWHALGASTGLVRPARHDAEAPARDMGQREILQFREFDNFHSRLPQLFPGADRSDHWHTEPHRRAAMQAFAAILSYARAEKIDLRLFISPVHARYLELYRRVGWWPLFESWKRALVGALEEEATGEPGRMPFQLWDLSVFNELTMETLPLGTDLTSRMRWYSDSSHYSREHGDLILDLILHRPRQVDGALAAAVRVDTRNIDAHLGRIRQDANNYRVTHRAEVAELGATARLLRRFARSRP